MPAGWLADRFDRRLLLASGVVIWAIAVAVNAALTTFLAVIAARVVVGAAEALIPPASYSLIRDGVDEQRRARALSVYTMALMVGTGLSLVLGGPLLEWVQSSGIQSALPFGNVSVWQATLFIIGIVGFPMALLIFLNKDPGRGEERGNAPVMTIQAVVSDLAVRKSLFVPLLVFSIANSMITYGLAAWMPTMISRHFQLGIGEIGFLQGTILLTMGPLGLGVAGMCMESRQRASGVARLGVLSVLVSFAVMSLSVLLCMSGTINTFWTLDASMVLFTGTSIALTSTLVTRTVSNHAVGLVMAIVLVLNGLVGQGLAPTLIALVSQHFFGTGPDALANGMAAVFGTSGLVATAGAIFLYRALRHIDRIARAEIEQVGLATQ